MALAHSSRNVASGARYFSISCSNELVLQTDSLLEEGAIIGHSLSSSSLQSS